MITLNLQTFGDKTSRERTCVLSGLSSWAQRRISASGERDPSLRSGWQALSPNVCWTYVCLDFCETPWYDI